MKSKTAYFNTSMTPLKAATTPHQCQSFIITSFFFVTLRLEVQYVCCARIVQLSKKKNVVRNIQGTSNSSPKRT